MSSTLTHLVKVLKRPPAMAAAFREKGWHCEITKDSQTMHKIILNKLSSSTKTTRRNQKEKGTK